MAEKKDLRVRVLLVMQIKNYQASFLKLARKLHLMFLMTSWKKNSKR